MNKNFADAKEHFIKEGYCSFNISEFDLEFSEFINKFLVCEKEKNLSELFYRGRFDSVDLETRFEYKTFEEAENYKKTLIEKYNSDTISQCWYWADVNQVDRLLKNNSDYKIHNLKNYLDSKIYSIMEYFYDLPKNSKINTNELSFSLYNKDCRFTQHQDGVGVNYCSMIIYLNKNYNEEDGGLLLLNDEYVIPELGVVALMDLSKHNIKHGVSKVLGGVGRFAILTFPILENI